MLSLHIPNLSTLNSTPSWHNYTGHIDRSACIEVRVSEVRRLAGCVEIDRSWAGRRDAKGRPLHITRPLPNERPARNTHGRVATGIYSITAHEVDALQQRRIPRRLAGDLRTPRANAMRPERYDASKGFKCRVTRNKPCVWPFDRGLHSNPNHGASRTKMIGLYTDWSQPLRIEKWSFPKRIRPAYYLICPGASRSQLRARSRDVNPLTTPPPLSNCGAGRKNPSTKICPQRVLKLFLVQCTKRESMDAELARLWIESIPPSLVPRCRTDIARLITRYGPIMEPRVLLCQRCLGLRYGNNPETVRQGWRRRNKRPDTTVAANLGDIMRGGPPREVPPEECTPEAGEREIAAERTRRRTIKVERRKRLREAEKTLPPEWRRKPKPRDTRRKKPAAQTGLEHIDQLVMRLRESNVLAERVLQAAQRLRQSRDE